MNTYFAHFIFNMPSIYDYESITCETDLKEYHTELVDYAKKLGGLMYESYSEWYNLEDYSNLYDILNEEELRIADDYKKDDIDNFIIIWNIIISRMEKVSSSINEGYGSLKDIAL